MRMNHDADSQRARFRLDEQTKAARAENLRRRFQAATPPTRRPPLQWPVDWRRGVCAGLLAVILVLVWLH